MTFSPEQQLLIQRRKAIARQLATMRSSKARTALEAEEGQLIAQIGKAYRQGGAESAYGAAYGIGGTDASA